MRTDQRGKRRVWPVSALIALMLFSSGALWGDEQVARNVLAEVDAPWQRLSPVNFVSPQELAGVVTCATTRFGLPDDGEVEVTLLEMGSTLDALGLFAAERPEEPQRVALASPAYWYEGTLRLFAGRRYLQLRPDRDDEQGLATAQQLALQLEMRFPPTEPLPRIMSIMPRRYLNPYLLHWGPMDVCGDGCEEKTLVATRKIGDQPLTISVVECADDAASRVTWTGLLNIALAAGPALELPGVAEEGFTGIGSDGRVCAAIRQDEFVVITSGSITRADAEAMLRIAGMHIRTTRPLPLVTPEE